MTDIFESIAPTTAKHGDYVRVETKRGARVEGEAEDSRFSSMINIAGFYIALGDVKTIERRRPKVVLPTARGGAVLFYDPSYLCNAVAVLEDPDVWSTIYGPRSTLNIEIHYVRTLFDPRQED